MRPLFPDTSDPGITLEIIRGFHDWAASIVSTKRSNLESFFESFATRLARDLQLPLVTVWDNNEYGECLVLQASVPKRPLELSHSIPIEGTLTGDAVKRRKISYSKVSNRVLVSEGITQMVIVPVPKLTDPEEVDIVINLYFSSDDNPTLPVCEKDAERLLSRLGTVLQNQIYKRDKEIEDTVRNVAASAKGISSLFDGISNDIQKITHCSYAILFSWIDSEKEPELRPEGHFFSDKEHKSAADIHKLRQKIENYSLDQLKSYCIDKKTPYVYCEEVDLPIPITVDNPVTIPCQYIAVPIISSEDKAIGVLACSDPSEKERLAPSFSSFDVRALQTFSNALSPSIERVLTSRQESGLITIIKKVSDSMVKSYDLNKNLQNAIETIVDTLNSEVGSVYRRRDETNTFEMLAAKGSNEDIMEEAFYEVGEGITGAIAEGQILHFKSREELITHPNYKGKYDQKIWGNRAGQKETFLGVPIVINGKVKGLWKVSNVTRSKSHPDPYYTDEDIQIAQVLSSFLAYAIQNHEQEEKRLKQFTSLANTSLQIQKAANEEEAIFSVILSLEEVEIAGMLLSLYDPQTKQLVGNQVLGNTWKEPAQQYKCYIDDDDIRAQVLRDNEERIVDLVLMNGALAPREQKVSKQFVLPLRLEDELIGTMQFDVGIAKLSDRRRLILKAFTSHLAIAISRLRSIRQTLELTNTIMVSSRFIIAETFSAMAVHSVHHKLKDINKQLRDDLEKREVRENRFLLDTLKDWRKILDGLERELNDILTFVRAPSDDVSTKPQDVHPEIQASISTWYNYIRGHNCKIHPPRLEATSSFCQITPQAFREILAVLFVNSVQAHAKNIEIRTYNTQDVQAPRKDVTEPYGTVFCLECSDDGDGLATNLPEEIFEANYTTKPANLGSGLGLFVARHLARYAGGDLEVKDTKQSKGVTFQLTLPLLEET
jgi:signal transduction histidine kinase